jgi:hypothetical protein
MYEYTHKGNEHHWSHNNEQPENYSFIANILIAGI